MAEINPAATSSDYDAQIGYWEKVDTILAGEDAIKLAKTKYLPKFANERQEVYDYRLSVSPFTNICADISQNLASKPFSDDLKLEEDTDKRYIDLSENVDGQGNNLHVFAANLFQDALNKGIAWIFVEFSKVRPRADGAPLTLQDERDQKLRPYWVHVPAQSMLAVYSAVVGGQETIYHACIRERSIRVDAGTFAETRVERYRHLSREVIFDNLGQIMGFGRATWTVWENVTNSADNKSAWVIVDQGVFSVGFIPLVPVTLTKRDGTSWVTPSPIRNIFDMQITEYRQESNLEWVKIMTVFPMFCVAGMDEAKQGEVTVGPNTVFFIPQNGTGTGPAGDVTVIETTGAASTELRNQLELFRKEMRDLGMQPLAVANLTVTLSNHVTKKASSQVEKWAFLFKDAIEKAWKTTAAWLGDNAEPEIVIHTDFAVDMESGTELAEISKATWLSDENKFLEFKRRGTIRSDAEWDENEEQIAGQQEGLEAEQSIDPTTGQPIVMPAAGAVPNPPRPLQ